MLVRGIARAVGSPGSQKLYGDAVPVEEYFGLLPIVKYTNSAEFGASFRCPEPEVRTREAAEGCELRIQWA
jgi:hypothetical protein